MAPRFGARSGAAVTERYAAPYSWGTWRKINRYEQWLLNSNEMPLLTFHTSSYSKRLPQTKEN
jgi:hypothetical protein